MSQENVETLKRAIDAAFRAKQQWFNSADGGIASLLSDPSEVMISAWIAQRLVSPDERGRLWIQGRGGGLGRGGRPEAASGDIRRRGRERQLVRRRPVRPCRGPGD